MSCTLHPDAGTTYAGTCVECRREERRIAQQLLKADRERPMDKANLGFKSWGDYIPESQDRYHEEKKRVGYRQDSTKAHG